MTPLGQCSEALSVILKGSVVGEQLASSRGHNISNVT